MLHIVKVLDSDGRMTVRYYKTMEAATKAVELTNKYYSGKKFASMETVEFQEDFSERLRQEKIAKGEKTFGEMTSQERDEYFKNRFGKDKK